MTFDNESVRSNNDVGRAAAPPDAPAPTNRRYFVGPSLALGIPRFYRSLGTGRRDAVLSFEDINSVSDHVRKFNSILLATLVAAMFKTSAQDNIVYWVLVSSSLIQATTGLVCSTIVAIFSLGHRGHEHLSMDETRLKFLCWTIWDLFSFPAVCTTWSTMTFIAALIADTVKPISSENDTCNAGQAGCSTAAKVVLLLIIIFSGLRFVFFMLHIRRLSNALGGVAIEA